jgi:hypothetical protein
MVEVRQFDAVEEVAGFPRGGAANGEIAGGRGVFGGDGDARQTLDEAHRVFERAGSEKHSLAVEDLLAHDGVVAAGFDHDFVGAVPLGHRRRGNRWGEIHVRLAVRLRRAGGWRLRERRRERKNHGITVPYTRTRSPST